MLGVLAQIDAYDPVASVAVSLYASSVDDPAVCHLNGQTWLPMLAKLPTLKYDLFDGAFEGKIAAPSSSMTMQTEGWPNFGRYELADARLRLWTGNVGDLWGSWTLRFDGRVSAQPKIADGAASIDFAVDDRWLDKALLATYAGATGIEGPAAMKGQAKPLALGAPRYVPGKLIDPTNIIYQLSAYGAINDVEAALERLLRFGASSGDYSSYTALVAATVKAGAWATCKASGLVRFGAPTAGQISFLAQGDNAGSDGWARKPGQLIRYLAKLSGGTGKIDDASLNALDTARPYNCSLYLDDQTTAREQIQRIAASVNAVAGISFTGQLFVVPVGKVTASATLAADGSSLPPVASVEQLDMAAPFAKLGLNAERAYVVHALSDIAFTAQLIDMGAYDGTKTYREGNVVQSQGINWTYINPTATTGNAPATLPTASNAYWKAWLSGNPTATTTTAPSSPAIGDRWAPGGGGVEYIWGGSAWAVIATRNDDSANMIAAPTDPSTWTLAGTGTSVVHLNNTRPLYDKAVALQAANATVVWGAKAPCIPGERLYTRQSVDADSFVPSTDNARVGLNFYDVTGTILSGGSDAIDQPGTAVSRAMAVAAGGAVTATDSVVVPTGAALVSMYTIRPAGTGGGTLYAGEPYLQRHQGGADVTSLNQITVELSAKAIQLTADYLGNLTAGQSADFLPVVKRNGITYNGDSGMTYALSSPTGGTWAVDSTLGSSTKSRVSFDPSTMTGNSAGARLTISYQGTAISSMDLSVTKKLGDPPTGGGGGGGGGGSTTAASISADRSTTGTTDVSVSSSSNPTLIVASGQKLYASYSGTYSLSGIGNASRSGIFTHQYSTDNATWSAFGSSVTGDPATVSGSGGPHGDVGDIERYDGSVTINQNVTVSPGTYYLRTVFHCNTTGRTIVLDGSYVTYEAKP